jgi:hypothetical protein
MMQQTRLVLYAISTGVSLYWMIKDFKRERDRQKEYELNGVTS